MGKILMVVFVITITSFLVLASDPIEDAMRAAGKAEDEYVLALKRCKAAELDMKAFMEAHAGAIDRLNPEDLLRYGNLTRDLNEARSNCAIGKDVIKTTEENLRRVRIAALRAARKEVQLVGEGTTKISPKLSRWLRFKKLIELFKKIK